MEVICDGGDISEVVCVSGNVSEVVYDGGDNDCTILFSINTIASVLGMVNFNTILYRVVSLNLMPSELPKKFRYGILWYY